MKFKITADLNNRFVIETDQGSFVGIEKIDNQWVIHKDKFEQINDTFYRSYILQDLENIVSGGDLGLEERLLRGAARIERLFSDDLIDDGDSIIGRYS